MKQMIIRTIKTITPATWRRILIGIAMTIAAGYFAVYVWPTEWRSLPVDQDGYAQRENRFTGEVQWLRKIGQEKYHTWRRH
jgi:hypothetical protein